MRAVWGSPRYPLLAAPAAEVREKGCEKSQVDSLRAAKLGRRELLQLVAKCSMSL